MIDIDEIETLARLATPGPWAVDSESVDKFDRLYVAKGIAGDLQGRILEVFANCLVTSDEERYVNAAFAAAANPAAILALIAEVRALRNLESAVRDHRAMYEGTSDEDNMSALSIGDAIAELDAARKEKA